MNFIKKVFDKTGDESTHQQFQKFSKGEFQNRAMIRAKCSSKKCTVNTTAEFANELVRDVAEKVGDNKVKITGALVSTADLTGELEFKDKKQFQGVKRYMIEGEMSGNEIIHLIDKFPKAFFALSFSTPDETTKLKIKPKAPKSGKPASKGGDKLKIDFCRLSTEDKEFARSFVFEQPEFKEAEIVHKYMIEQIKIPEELKSSKDFALIREKSMRVGKIIREAIIDDKEINTEIALEA